MLAAFGAMDTPHIQHNTRPTVCGTVNISCSPCAPCAIAIPTKSLGKIPAYPPLYNTQKPKLIPQTLRKSEQAPSRNVSSKFLPNKSPTSPSQTSKTATEKKERKKKFLTYYTQSTNFL
jgi:hypothetical protein